MGRKASFQGSSKAFVATTAQTIVFTPTDIESAGCVQLMFALTGAANDIADFDRIRVRAGGDVIVDCSVLQLQAYQQRWSNRFVSNVAGDTAFSIPLNFLDAPRGMNGEPQDRCQFPPNREIQVELVTLATIPAAGTVICGWKQTDVPAEFFMRYYSSVLNLPASSRNVKYTFAEPGIVRGLTLPTAGIDRAELYVSDRTAWRLPGAQFGGVTIGDLWSQKDFFEDGASVTAAKHRSVDLGIPAAAGSSYLVMDTGAAWAGATNEGAFYAIVPLARKA